MPKRYPFVLPVLATLTALLVLSALFALSAPPALAADYPIGRGFSDVRWGTPRGRVSGLTFVAENADRGDTSYRRADSSSEVLGVRFDYALWLFREDVLTGVYFEQGGVDRRRHDEVREQIAAQLGTPQFTNDRDCRWRYGETYVDLFFKEDEGFVGLYLQNLQAYTAQAWKDPGGAYGFLWGDTPTQVLRRGAELGLEIEEQEPSEIIFRGRLDGHECSLRAIFDGPALTDIGLIFPNDGELTIHDAYRQDLSGMYREPRLTPEVPGKSSWRAGNTYIALQEPDEDGVTRLYYHRIDITRPPLRDLSNHEDWMELRHRLLRVD